MIFENHKIISHGRIFGVPSIPLLSILKVLFSSAVLGFHNFNLIETCLKEGSFNKFLSSSKFNLSADTLGYALARTTLRQFIEIRDPIIKKARYGKVFQGKTIDGMPELHLNMLAAYDSI